MIQAALGAALRLAVAAFVLALILGALIARYFLRLVSSMTKIFAP